MLCLNFIIFSLMTAKTLLMIAFILDFNTLTGKAQPKLISSFETPNYPNCSVLKFEENVLI